MTPTLSALLLTALVALPAVEEVTPPKPLLDPPTAERRAGGRQPGERQRPRPIAPTAASETSKPGAPPAGRSATSAQSAQAPAERSGPPPQLVEHDTVILDNEQRFRGTVLSNQTDEDWVAINTGNGIMRIRRERVVRVEYGLTARMGQVKSDDVAGLIDLARWCRANGRNPEAMQLLTKAVSLPACDLESRGLYAQLVDELDGAEKALPLYVAYRNAGGTDADILARLVELETAHRVWEEQMRALGLDPGTSAATGQPTAAATASSVDEGYEKYKWDPDSADWSSPAKPSLITLVTPDGPRRVLQIDYEAHPTKPNIDKAAVVLRRPLALRADAKLTFLAANRSTKDVRIGIAVKTGTEWTYYESKPQVLKATSSGQEFAQLTFDLSAADFKAQATNWAHSARIANLEQVRELQILFHNGRNDGSVWIAGLNFEGGAP
jgi:hypothetical protein